MTLTIELRATGDGLRATYTNRGEAPLALTFWWNRSMIVHDATGARVQPTDGPRLPCGVAEDHLELAPGAAHERDEPLACTQPAGSQLPIGWRYDLAPGTYRVRLVYTNPPVHGFRQSEPRDDEPRGTVESNEVTLVVTAPAKRGLLSRLLG